MVYADIKRPVFKGINTIRSLLTEESRPPWREQILCFVQQILANTYNIMGENNYEQ